MIRLYDLRGADPEVRPSPYCWLVKWALLHKNLAFETVPLGFSEKQNYPDAEHALVPVLLDGDVMVRDSAAILAHLEATRPNPPLTKTAGERAAVAFYWSWLTADLLPSLARLSMFKIYEMAAAGDREYFRRTREQRFGARLETLADDPALPGRVQSALAMLERPLGAHLFLGGDGANHADYLVGGFLMWSRLVGSDALFTTPKPVAGWMERMLDLYDGYGRRAKRAVD